MFKHAALAFALATLPALALAQIPLTEVTTAASSPAAVAPTSAAPGASAEKGIYVTDPTTGERRQLALDDARNPDMLASVLPRIDGVEPLFRAYIAQGYAPFHAYILTNGDLMDIVKKASPDLPINPTLQQKIQSVRDLYQPTE